MTMLSERRRLRATVLAVTIVGCGVVWVAWASGMSKPQGGSELTALAEPNDLRWDLAEAFTFSWETAELSAKVTNLSDDDTSQHGIPERIINVSVDVGWNLEAKGLVIVDVNAPQIYELLDEDGNVVEYQNAQSDQYRCYKDDDWCWTQDGVAHPRATNYEPFNVRIRLPTGAAHPAPSTISVLKGYIWAVYADAIVNVDVPYDPNYGDFESEMAPGLMISVDPTTSPAPEPVEYICLVPSAIRGCASRRLKRAMGLYQYKTWVKPTTDQPVWALSEGIRSPGSVYAYHDYAVIGTVLFDSNRVVAWSADEVVYDMFGINGVLCMGVGAQSGDTSEVFDSIRHVIAVHPVEVKIPFVLTNIPVPSVQSANK